MKNLTIQGDHGQADPKWITDFEQEVGITLPTSYVELMLAHNGVSVVERDFDYLDREQFISTSSIGFYAFGNAIGTSIINQFQWAEFNDYYSHKNVVPFGSNGAGDKICFDYRQNPTGNNPPIILMYHDEFVMDENGNEKMMILPIANNFDEFLGMLYEEKFEGL